MTVCPKWEELSEGFDDPITVAYGAADVIADSIQSHIKVCQHEWCRGQRWTLSYQELVR